MTTTTTILFIIASCIMGLGLIGLAIYFVVLLVGKCKAKKADKKVTTPTTTEEVVENAEDTAEATNSEESNATPTPACNCADTLNNLGERIAELEKSRKEAAEKAKAEFEAKCAKDYQIMALKSQIGVLLADSEAEQKNIDNIYLKDREAHLAAVGAAEKELYEAETALADAKRKADALGRARNKAYEKVTELTGTTPEAEAANSTFKAADKAYINATLEIQELSTKINVGVTKDGKVTTPALKAALDTANEKVAEDNAKIAEATKKIQDLQKEIDALEAKIQDRIKELRATN